MLILKRPSVLPGFGLAMGTAVLYLGLIVLVPLSATFLKTATLSWGAFFATVTAPRVPPFACHSVRRSWLP